MMECFAEMVNGFYSLTILLSLEVVYISAKAPNNCVLYFWRFLIKTFHVTDAPFDLIFFV